MSFMPVVYPKLSTKSAAGIRSYGWRRLVRQIAAVAFCSYALSLGTPALGTLSLGKLSLGTLSLGALIRPALAQSPAQTTPIQIVALGDSLTAGYGLPDREGFVPRLQAALAAKGIPVMVANGGVSGDTASDGLTRLDWSVPDGTQAVILELGANDMLRGIKPQVTREALDKILQRLTRRHVAVMLCGMRAAPNLGADYATEFEQIYPDLAAKYGTMLYPFFLDGVAGDLKLTQPDGMHPNAAGVAVIVDRILPAILQLIDQIHTRHPA